MIKQYWPGVFEIAVMCDLTLRVRYLVCIDVFFFLCVWATTTFLLGKFVAWGLKLEPFPEDYLGIYFHFKYCLCKLSFLVERKVFEVQATHEIEK